MTIIDTRTETVAPTDRVARPRRYAMTPPTYFQVDYSINPWMDPAVPVDAERALRQWDTLRRTYLDLGHRVDVVTAVAGLPDMVYAANGGLVVDGVAIAARFTFAQRAAEADAYADWMGSLGVPVHRTRHRNEGQGDLLLVDGTLLAGSGFRTDRDAHDEIAELTGRDVVSLTLVDPRYYHLDTCLTVLDDTTVAYHPPAFDAASQRLLAEMFPSAIIVAEGDAGVLGLNAVSDGRHVVHPAAATGYAAQLRDHGFEPVGVDLSELLKGGGSVKCCTLEIHPH